MQRGLEADKFEIEIINGTYFHTTLKINKQGVK